MKRNLLAIALVALVVAALVFVATPATQAETVTADHIATEANADGALAIKAKANDIIDLNGIKGVVIEVADGGAVTLVDTSFMAGEEWDLSGTNVGTATFTSGSPVRWAQFNAYKYLAVQNGNTYSAHPFNLTITKYGINPTSNLIALRATYVADDVVRAMITDMGIFNSVDSVSAGYKIPDDTNGTHAYFDIKNSLDSGNLEANVNIKAYIMLGDEKIESNYTYTFSPLQVLQQLNKEYNTLSTYNKSKAMLLYRNNENLQQYLANLDPVQYTMKNGGFENGLEGWTVVGNIGNVSSDTHYWVGDPESADGFAFGMDGEKMFSAYAPGAAEAAVGTLTSPSFKVGGSGFVTFKIGALRDGNYVYVDVVDAETKVILARYYNGLWADRTEGVKSGCTLVAYKADLSAFMDREVFFRISDNADREYGLFFADSFNTYYETEPEGFNAATPVDYEVSGTIYDVANGGFERGNDLGWWSIGEIGLVTDASGYWGDNIPYGKDGNYLFTGVESNGADTMREGNRGSLTSSVFEIGGTGKISFKLGGGGNALCYVQVIDATTGEILARYHQQAMQDAKLIQYVADLSAYIGRTARIQVVDQADSGWGCVSFDNVVTYYPEGAALPEGITANDIKGDLKYTIDNGSFETGNIEGWTMNITEAGAHNTVGWVLETEIDAGWYAKNDETKDGKFLFTFAQPGDINCENTKGTLQSSTFSLKQGAFVAFKFGGAGNARNHDVYIELCRADGSVIAKFYNDAEGKVNTRMNAYYYQYTGAEVNCFFRVVDNSTGDYGCFVVDDFRVNLETAPEGFIAAIQ